MVKGKVFYRLANVIHATIGPLRVNLRNDEGKFFSSEAASQISRTDPAFDGSGNLLEQDVSHLMAEGVVKMLEVIEVQHDQGKKAAGSLRPVQFTVQRFL